MEDLGNSGSLWGQLRISHFSCSEVKPVPRLANLRKGGWKGSLLSAEKGKKCCCQETPGTSVLIKMGHLARPRPQRPHQLERPGKKKHETMKE